MLEKYCSAVYDAHSHNQTVTETVLFSKQMPDIEQLMEAWPATSGIENILDKLPTHELDVGLEEMVDIVCTILDIPVYDTKIQNKEEMLLSAPPAQTIRKSRTESLYQLFSLYAAFNNSQHFTQ